MQATPRTSSSREDNLPQAKRPKIRLSCDSCQKAKVRCGQERPACHRCLDHGIECTYSPSRRMGRPRGEAGCKSRGNSTKDNGNHGLAGPTAISTAMDSSLLLGGFSDGSGGILDGSIIDDQSIFGLDFPTHATPGMPLDFDFAAMDCPIVDLQGSASNGQMETCRCSASLLQHLEQMEAAVIPTCKPLLDRLSETLTCPSCSSKVSTALIVCQAVDRVSKSLERTMADESRVRVGTYAVDGADRRVLIRGLTLRRLRQLQAVMTQLRAGRAGSACERVRNEVVTETLGRLHSSMDTAKRWI